MTEQQQGSQLLVTPRTVHVEGMVGEAETRCWLGSEHKGERGREEEWGRQGQVLFNGAGVLRSIQLGILAQGRGQDPEETEKSYKMEVEKERKL